MPNQFEPNIWGPHYWFFLHTLAINYPNYPNDITKKKYYEFIHNLPLFIPNETISNDFLLIINEYPVKPYLDNKDSFVRWVNFIHNKINEKLEKPSISLNDFYINYFNLYKSNNIKLIEYLNQKKKIIYLMFMLLLFVVIYYLYDK
jgi:hypothetical protein